MERKEKRSLFFFSNFVDVPHFLAGPRRLRLAGLPIPPRRHAGHLKLGPDVIFDQPAKPRIATRQPGFRGGRFPILVGGLIRFSLNVKNTQGENERRGQEANHRARGSVYPIQPRDTVPGMNIGMIHDTVRKISRFHSFVRKWVLIKRKC